MNWEGQLAVALEAAQKAQEIILEVYHRPFTVVMKEDHSPVTEADQKADALIRQILHEAYPDYAFLTEESEDDPTRLTNDYCWIVDPVDGTKDFVARDGEFTTNIALAYRHEVVVGVVMIPVLNICYFASRGAGAFRKTSDGEVEAIHVNDKKQGLTMLVSHFHVDEREQRYFDEHQPPLAKLESYGSALKACKIAEGSAELQLKFGAGTKEWDVAASQIIVEEAGGVFVDPHGKPFRYNREDVYNHEGFLIGNSRDILPIR